MKKTFFSPILVLLFALGATITGCGRITATTETPEVETTLPRPVASSTPSSTPDIPRGTVIIWHSWDEAQRSALYRWISNFQSKYPEIQFDVQYISAIDLKASFEAAMGESGGPTILLGPAEWGPSLLSQGWVLDLSSRVKPELVELLNPAGADSGLYQDQRISLPLALKGVVLFRNKAIVPAAPVSFEELVASATTATKNGNVGADLERSFYYSAGHLYGLGGSLMTADGKPNFDQDDFAKAQEWLSLLKSFELAGMTEYQTDSDLKLFEEGKTGFIIDSTWNMFILAGEVGPLNLTIDPWPTYKDGHLSGFVQSESIYLTRRAETEDHDISWLFIQSLYNQANLLALADVNLIPPLKVAKLVQPGTELKLNNPFVGEAMQALDMGTTYPITPDMNLYTTQFDVTLQSILYQAVNSRMALQRAFDVIQAAINTENPSLSPTP